AVTIVIRGGTEHVVDEADRSLHDALCVVRNALEDGKIVAGGGAPEAELAKRLREYAVKVGGREQLAIEAFAESLEAVPTTLAENAGLDPIDVLVELRSKHERAGSPWFGIDVFSGDVKDMRKQNVLEPLRVKQQVIKSASEAASMILRIDDVIASKGVDKGAGGGKDFKPPGDDEEFYDEPCSSSFRILVRTLLWNYSWVTIYFHKGPREPLLRREVESLRP